MSEENPARGTPEPKAAVIPAAPVASSLPAQESTAVERAGKANSPADVRSLLSDLRKAKPAPAVEGKPAAAAAEPAPTETAAHEATEETAANEETPAAEETETPAPAEDAETDDDDGGEGPISPITGKRTHIRLPENDQVGRLASAYMRRNKDMGMVEAVERAHKQLGIKPAGAAEPAAEAAPKSDLPTTVEEVDAKLEQLIEEREKAMTGLYVEDAMKLERSIRQLDRHRLVLERQVEVQQTKAAADYDTAFSSSEKKAAELYPFVGEPEGKGVKRMIEIEAQLKENNDPLYSSPDKPLRIAQMVAAELNIAPKRKGSPAAPAQAAAPANGTPAPKRQMLPTGGSRTTPPASNPQQALTEEVSKITNPHQLRNFLKPLVAKR